MGALVSPLVWVLWCSFQQVRGLPYCAPLDSFPEDRAIPPLEGAEKHEGLRLVHVAVVTRHGARTPSSKDAYSKETGECWPSYGETVRWECDDLRQLLLPTERQEGEPIDTDTRFRMVYDGSFDAIRGSCHKGALLARGFEQQMELGELLREAYLGDSPLHLSVDPEPERLRIRSDDMQRTLLSAQALVLGYLENTEEAQTIQLHTSDISLDPIAGYTTYTCPSLAEEAYEAAKQSSEFEKFNTSQEVTDLISALAADTALGPNFSFETGAFDCLATALCEDVETPPGITPELFERAQAYEEGVVSNTLLYDNARAARLTSAAMLNEIMVDLDTRAPGEGGLLTIYSGHDGTLIRLLNVLAPGSEAAARWPPYAAMLALEVYEDGEGEDHFRLVYNGEVLSMPGCSAQLCPWHELQKQLSWVEGVLNECAQAVKDQEDGVQKHKATAFSGNTILVGALSCLLGGVILGFAGSLTARAVSKRAEGRLVLAEKTLFFLSCFICFALLLIGPSIHYHFSIGALSTIPAPEPLPYVPCRKSLTVSSISNLDMHQYQDVMTAVMGRMWRRYHCTVVVQPLGMNPGISQGIIRRCP
ncbi:unnamed protein product, partial [Chrysoparadoxa australica]